MKMIEKYFEIAHQVVLYTSRSQNLGYASTTLTQMVTMLTVLYANQMLTFSIPQSIEGQTV